LLSTQGLETLAKCSKNSKARMTYLIFDKLEFDIVRESTVHVVDLVLEYTSWISVLNKFLNFNKISFQLIILKCLFDKSSIQDHDRVQSFHLGPKLNTSTKKLLQQLSLTTPGILLQSQMQIAETAKLKSIGLRSSVIGWRKRTPPSRKKSIPD
jgi:hypothetical protein